MNDAPSMPAVSACSSEPLNSGLFVLSTKSATSTAMGGGNSTGAVPREKYQVLATSAAISTAARASSRGVNFRTLGSGIPRSSSAARLSARRALVWNRAAGSGCRHRVMILSSASGTFSLTERGAGGAAAILARSSLNALGACACRCRPTSMS